MREAGWRQALVTMSVHQMDTDIQSVSCVNIPSAYANSSGDQGVTTL